MDAADVVTKFWATCEARDWDGFGRLLADDVVYEVPQTRERVRGRAGVVRFTAEFPGAWHLALERVVGDAAAAASRINFTLEGTEQTGLAFFELDHDGLIARIEDYWPERYEPPPGRAHLAERF